MEIPSIVLDTNHKIDVKGSDQASRYGQNEEKDEVEDHLSSVGERLGQSSLDLKSKPGQCDDVDDEDQSLVDHDTYKAGLEVKYPVHCSAQKCKYYDQIAN